jgi:hypothetical protein
MKLLVHHPVADDVLDVVRHHREHGGAQEPAEVGTPDRGERLSGHEFGGKSGGCLQF